MNCPGLVQDPQSNYHVKWNFGVKGTWRTLEGANPFNGEIGEITVADEMRLEFVVDDADIKDVIVTIKRYHPYEEPVIDIIPMTDWKTFIPSDDM